MPREQITDLARAAHHGWPGRFADQITEALNSETFTARDYLVRAKAHTIRLTATQLLAIGAQRRVWEKRMGPPAARLAPTPQPDGGPAGAGVPRR